MSRMGFPDVFCAVACGMNDFLDHSVQRKSSVHPLGDVETLKSIGCQHHHFKLRNSNYQMPGWTSNHSWQNELLFAWKTNPGAIFAPSALTHSIMVTSSKFALLFLYFARFVRGTKYFCDEAFL